MISFVSFCLFCLCFFEKRPNSKLNEVDVGRQRGMHFGFNTGSTCMVHDLIHLCRLDYRSDNSVHKESGPGKEIKFNQGDADKTSSLR